MYILQNRQISWAFPTSFHCTSRDQDSLRLTSQWIWAPRQWNKSLPQPYVTWTPTPLYRGRAVCFEVFVKQKAAEPLSSSRALIWRCMVCNSSSLLQVPRGHPRWTYLYEAQRTGQDQVSAPFQTACSTKSALTLPSGHSNSPEHCKSQQQWTNLLLKFSNKGCELSKKEWSIFSHKHQNKTDNQKQRNLPKWPWNETRGKTQTKTSV